MTDHAVFIPTSEGPVGGIVSEPGSPARAGLLLMPGYGRPARSGTNSFWTRVARELAGHGLVVLRVDYAREGETLPIGEGVSGQVAKNELETRLFACILPWFRARLDGLDLLLAGSCSGARGAIELAGRSPDAFSGTFLVAPHLRVLGDAGPAPGEHPADGDPGAVAPGVVEQMRAILAHGPSWILVGDEDRADVPRLQRLLGTTPHPLEVEVVPNAALHLLDQPERQEQTRRRLVARIARAIGSSEARGSQERRAPASA